MPDDDHMLATSCHQGEMDAFGTLYTLHPNIYQAALVHAFLNFAAVYLGFFTFLDASGKTKRTELHLK